jgi:hypothetical protein
MEPVICDPVRDFLQVRDDDASKAIVSEYSAKLRKCQWNFVSEEMFDAVGAPNGVDSAIRNSRKIGDVRQEIGLGVRVDIYPYLSPTSENSR